jgi:peptide/nickel transport system permease protein
VLWRHRLRNALLPLVTMVGVQASALFGGSVVVESLFAIPGIGRLAFDSVMQRDYPMLLGILFVGAVLVSAVNLAVDLALAGLDPRIRLEPPAGRRGF